MLNYVKQVLSADLFPDIPGQAWAWQLENLPYNLTQCTAEQRTAMSLCIGSHLLQEEAFLIKG